ncbi:alpha/beta hydrolase [Pseudonocardia sp.]|uniref:alpha/beta hydrolase n=1 Tax=Pseudonocardia sp. TaxID=60912 RepID=UPI003D10FE92
MEAITFPHGRIRMAGNLHLPIDFDARSSYAAVVTVHPGGGVKEQTAGLYAARLADEGFVALAFDASHQGESGGEPRHVEDPAARVEDVRVAVDYLQTLRYVDPERIGALGICAGGGYAVHATMTDHRIRAVATVSCVDIGTTWRRGWYGADLDAAAAPALEDVARQRTAEAGGAEVATSTYVPREPDARTPHDLVEAHEYQVTARGGHPNAQNRYLTARSTPRIAAFDAFHLVEDLLTQPILLVAGSEAGSLWHSTGLHARVRGPKKLVIVDGGGHTDFYDVPKYVDRAVREAVRFFTGTLVVRERE